MPKSLLNRALRQPKIQLKRHRFWGALRSVTQAISSLGEELFPQGPTTRVDPLPPFRQVFAVHPVAFQFGALTITWYGVMVALAFMVGIWNGSRRAAFAGIHSETVVDLGPWLIIGGIAGARALYVITFWREQFASAPITEFFQIWHGGLVFYGGLIGAAIATIVLAKIKRVPMWVLGDILAPSLALGYALGRIGCLLNGCCYGRPCGLPWAIHFPDPHQTFPHPVHPTQIYDALLALGLCAVLAKIFKRRRFDGQIFVLFLMGYAVLRSAVECFRGDYPENLRYFGGWVTPAQIGSFLIALTAFILWWLLPRQLVSNAGTSTRTQKCPEPVRR
jgi:phosphatidylglycerol:prolipoprotein diacylglycerol transferase